MDPRLRDPQLVPSKRPERFRDSSYCWGVLFGPRKHREGAKKLLFLCKNVVNFHKSASPPPLVEESVGLLMRMSKLRVTRMRMVKIMRIVKIMHTVKTKRLLKIKRSLTIVRKMEVIKRGENCEEGQNYMEDENVEGKNYEEDENYEDEANY